MKRLSEIISYENNVKRADALETSIKNHTKSVTSDHEKALISYQSGSHAINSNFWEAHDKGRKYYDSRTARIDDVLQMNKTPHKMVVYSGTLHDPRQIKNKNNIVHHPAYLSTSLKQSEAEAHAAKHEGGNDEFHVLKIHVPKGHPGAYLHKITGGFEHEKEFLLPHGLNMKYKKTVTHDGDDGWRYHTHHMEVV